MTTVRFRHRRDATDVARQTTDLEEKNDPRQQGAIGLKGTYGLQFKQFRSLDTAGPVTVAALQHGDITVADLFSTDPAIAVDNFVVLDDPKDLFGSQNVTPLVYKSAVDDTVRKTLNTVSAKARHADLDPADAQGGRRQAGPGSGGHRLVEICGPDLNPTTGGPGLRAKAPARRRRRFRGGRFSTAPGPPWPGSTVVTRM